MSEAAGHTVPTEAQVYEWLQTVRDPEVPVLTVLELGVVRGVRVEGDGAVTVVITPTYSGCPAMDMISMNIRLALIGFGVKKVQIEQRLHPAWTTDWISEEGKRKLLEYGIAPPVRRAAAGGLFEEEEVPCPRCGSAHTELVSQYGATSCKSMYRCLDCKEPFEHFKCH